MTSSSDLHWCGSSANPASSAMPRSMFTSPKSKSAIMMVPRSVRVTGHSLGMHDVPVGDREVQAASGVHLAGVRPEQLLPGCLVVELRRGVVPPALGDLLVAELHVEAMRRNVEGDAVPGAQNREVAAGGSLGAGVEDRR